MRDDCELHPGLVTADQRAELLAEAAAERPAASRNRRYGYSLVDGDRLLGPVRNWVAVTGATRGRIHTELTARLAGIVEAPVEPTLSCYLYYEPGDFVGLHRDQARCGWEALVWLAGDCGPLCLHPELAGLPAKSLLRRARAGTAHPDATTAVDVRCGPLVLSGTVVPHHRLPHPGPGTLTLAAFCYAPVRPFQDSLTL